MPFALLSILAFSISGTTQSNGAKSVAIIAYLCFAGLAYMRFQNAGAKILWTAALAAIIPFLNLFVFVWGCMAPEGYYDHRRIDAGGRFAVVLLAVLGILGLAVALWSFRPG